MITVLMGAPAAGKSTWLTANMTGLEHIYNTEAIRKNKEIDVNAYMSFIRFKAIKAAEDGKDIIADGTHTFKAHRHFWLILADRLNLETKLVAFDTALPVLLAGNSIRQHPATTKILYQHNARMKIALRAIEREQWGSIEVIRRGYE
jgi:predicted kinase